MANPLRPGLTGIPGRSRKGWPPSSGTLLTTRFTRTVPHRGDLAGFYAVYGEGEPIELRLTRTQELVLLELLPAEPSA